MQRFKVGLLAFMYALFPMRVFASASTTDAVSDIMNNSRFQGAIESIQFLTGLVDYWFTAIISLTAFFIISAALLKNACAGAYVSNHKFWDKVAEAHEKTDALSISGIKDYFVGKQFLSTSAGGVRDFLLGLVPNIKAMTDFDDADIEPKQYFTKAIPQMLACIIIGVFIYNGFYRDAASTVGNFGSEICNRIFCSIDPAAFLDKVSQTTATPENIYAKDTSQQGKDCYALSMELYKTYLSVSKEMTGTEAKTALMRDCENIAKNTITSHKFFTSKIYSKTRLYDFSLTNLNITPCPQPNKGLNEVHNELADKNTKSKYTCSVYVAAPRQASNYVKDNQQYCYISFVMSGKEKSTTSIGLSSISAAAGTWGSSVADTISIKVSIKDKTAVTNGRSKNNGKVTLSGGVHLLKVVDMAAVEKAVKKFCKDSNLTYVADSIEKLVFQKYGSGTAQDPMIQFNDVAPGTSKSCDVSVLFSVKQKQGSETISAEERLTIPLKITLTQ